MRSEKDNDKLSKAALTVIVPAYNVEAYITDCIQSVVLQNGAANHVKVIVVIDRATDKTLDVAQLASIGHEDYVRIVVQENVGLSGARNTGIALVETEYVTFLDGDDVWASSFLDIILPIITTNYYDLIEYDAQMIDEAGNLISPLKIAFADNDTSCEVTARDFLKYFRCYSWARIFRTRLVRHRPFPLGKRFEDAATTPWYYWHSQRMLSLGHALVGYRQRPNSILKTPSPTDVENLASATTSAAAMFAETQSIYWQLVAHRIFQQACRRITWQILTTWPASLRCAREAIHDVPPPPGLVRWMQFHVTPLYVALLWLKRKLLRN